MFLETKVGYRKVCIHLLLYRWDADNDSSTPSTPSVSTPNRLRPLSSALEDRLASASSSEDIPSAQDLQPSANPSALLQTVLQQLQQANGAKRKELDWQMQNQVCMHVGREDWLEPGHCSDTVSEEAVFSNY